MRAKNTRPLPSECKGLKLTASHCNDVFMLSEDFERNPCIGYWHSADIRINLRPETVIYFFIFSI